MFIKLNLWQILKRLVSSEPMSDHEQDTLLINLEPAIEEGFQNYGKLPQEEKDRLCIELAQRMGCESDNILVCQKFIYDYAFDKEVS